MTPPISTHADPKAAARRRLLRPLTDEEAEAMPLVTAEQFRAALAPLRGPLYGRDGRYL